MNSIESSMKTIEVDDDVYRHIASHTLQIGESASDILRRLLGVASQTSKLGDASEQCARVRVVEQLLADEHLRKEKKSIARFMWVLKTLYESDPARFGQATAIRGRTRVYFSMDPKELSSHGNTTKPKAVLGTPYWVISNTNTTRKRHIVGQLMQAMGYPDELTSKICKFV